MLYDHKNREIPETGDAGKPIVARLVRMETSDRYEADVSRSMSPSLLDAIFRSANTGDVEAQARLSQEIEEKDFQSSHALTVRRMAVAGLSWQTRPPRGMEKDATAKKVAEAADEALRTSGQATAAEDDLEGFDGAVAELLGALLPGYALLEVVWGPGGKTIDGFAGIASHAVTFRNGTAPMLVSKDTPQGAPLVPRKFAWHRHKARSGDVARGGLIRPLGWMYCFANLGIKDLLRFVERYGMPFLLAKIDENSWQKDRAVIAQLVRNFGSDGGAVFSKSVEAELLAASANQGDTYFRMLDFFGEWKTRTILGQTATSGDAGGFSKGQAQSDVRQDLLESDCRQIEATVRRDILAPWVLFNFGEGAPVPELHIDCEQDEDLELKSKIVLNLSQAGYQVADEAVQEAFGMPVTRKPETAPGGLALAGEPRAARRVRRRALALSAQAATDKVVEAALREITRNPEIVLKWLRPVQEALDEALAGLPEQDAGPEAEEALRGRLEALVGDLPGIMEDMDASALEDLIARAMFAADLNGRIAAAGGLPNQEGMK